MSVLMFMLTQLSCEGLISCDCDYGGDEDTDNSRYCGGGGWSISVASKSKKAKKE